MWLLNTSTLQLEEFTGTQIPPYAILSHTWGEDEVGFQEWQAGVTDLEAKAGFAKILGCCKQARTDGLSWAWVDSCCIDKKSSAELTEAINSMFKWYQNSQVCYVYLDDVPETETSDSPSFRYSRWFTRGWTLQEILAPENVTFFSRGWREIGQVTLASDPSSGFMWTLGAALKFNPQFLVKPHLVRKECVGQRMRWAAHRETTREEDQAYCLLGLFDVNMPIVYGEGMKKAFKRLQYEIIQSTFDHTIFAWNAPLNNSGLLADSPAAFTFTELGYLQRAFPASSAAFRPYAMTNLGLSIKLRLKPAGKGLFRAELMCNRKHGEESVRMFVYLKSVQSHMYGWGNLYRRVRCDEDCFLNIEETKQRTVMGEWVDIYVVEDELWSRFNDIGVDLG